MTSPTNHHNIPASIPRRPPSQFFSDEFVISAGSILFREAPNPTRLQVCIIYQRRKCIWLLPKGRKDLGETMEATAVRETFEETGYPCELLPCTLPTRAPKPPNLTSDVVRHMEDATEPFAITVRDLGKKGTKFIWWYLTHVIGEKKEGTQMASECYDSHFFDVEEAVAKLRLEKDRDLVLQAAYLVEQSGIRV